VIKITGKAASVQKKVRASRSFERRKDNNDKKDVSGII
jgi:hypothetical protein